MWMHIRSGVCGGMMGVLLAHMGYYLTSWEFWAVFAILIAYGINWLK